MAVSRLRFVFKDNGTYYIDLARALSLQERRLHRQKMIYTVYGGQMASHTTSNGATETVKINTIPNTWPMKTAINRGFRLWKKQRSVAMKNADLPKGISGKYSDYKILMNAHHSASSETEADNEGYTILPSSSHDEALFNANTPEWDYSDMVVPAQDAATAGQTAVTDSFLCMAVGGTHSSSTSNGVTTYTRVSLVRSWLDSRATPDLSGTPVLDPDFDSDPLNNLFGNSDTSDEVLELIDTENDTPPYDEADVFGSCQSTANFANLQRSCVVITTAMNKIQPVAGFQSLCGLIQVKVDEVSGSGDIADEKEVELILDVETRGEKF